MKRFISAAAVLVMMLIFIPSFAIEASAAHNYAKGWDGDSGKSCLIDNADLFSDQQEKELNQMIRSQSEKLRINIMVYVAGSDERYRSDHDTEIFADDFYDETFGEDTDGVLLYMDFSGKSPAYDVLSTSGEAALKYGGDITPILHAVQAYFPPSSVTDYSGYSENLKEGVIHFLDRLTSYDEAYRKSLFYYYRDEYTGKYFYYKFGKFYVTKSKPPALKLLVLFIASALGGLVSVIVYFTTKSSYKFKASTNARVYVSSADGVERFGWQDQFIRSYQTRTRIDSDSGGGGGSRGGGGGGHSHSGGHRTGGSHR